MKTLKITLLTTLYLILIILIFSSCSNNNETVIKKDITYEVVIIDSCEYLKRYNGYNLGYSFTHKGNCKFCTERNLNNN